MTKNLLVPTTAGLLVRVDMLSAKEIFTKYNGKVFSSVVDTEEHLFQSGSIDVGKPLSQESLKSQRFKFRETIGLRMFYVYPCDTVKVPASNDSFGRDHIPFALQCAIEKNSYVNLLYLTYNQAEDAWHSGMDVFLFSE